MNIITVSFFGHRRIHNSILIERALEEQIMTLLRTHEYVEFLVGRDGDFDQLAASTVLRCKHSYRDDNSSLVCVLPYLKSEFRDNEESFRSYYDEIEVCEEAAGAHYKSAFRIRNRHMVDRSQLVLFCIDHNSGGAYQTMLYARKQDVPYLNLSPNAIE